MKLLLRTSDFADHLMIVDFIEYLDGYKNGLARVKYEDKVFLTGGILCRLTDTVFTVLSELSNEDQWKLLLHIKFPLPIP